ncbi:MULTISPECIES: TrbI/VirB10 family protein [Bradyrhizobium]|uniref:Conjugal transfer protein TraI n=3 Tax=Bradyrhizobium TaxID=374 RepID=A0AAE6CCD7_9BRAD|nr:MULTISPECIES: TrbI/VirB10 family protein [Bradyrhizobium]MCG2632809.1 TrbI/VirB10 family protein [Bradyrhizobium zhengyangense]MCG2645464.1 TrbI/VirB10 family protein [Bradyrhizobium zhengyangense]MCG2672902.1 TrbI/VirB10 family protein [Bradyrhizobium zhengyangense]MDN4988682.1 TrbI/VirB10 family protein [Bradyrhizobium sp. WYCCWR 13022]MDN5006257.1 TrbI/VirB10 family protein [Bradyrhizobium sp. WYCCWR 12677]
MTEEHREDETSPDGEQETGELEDGFRLRPEYPSVTRLSRKVLLTGSALCLALVAAAATWALQKQRPREAASEELYLAERHNVAESVTALPPDYSKVTPPVPQLGPPLPGDLGRPILAAKGQIAAPGAAADQEQQRRDQEQEAARVSRLFASTNVRDTAASSGAQAGGANAPSLIPSSEDGSLQNAQDRKLAFVNAATDRRTTSPDRLVKAPSPYVVQAGSVIAGALITGIRSDLPGMITAQVSENVYDTPTGRFLLIPQGARLTGIYDSQVSFGQSRVLLVWTRLIMPNGRSVVLERQPGTDTQGYAGLEDQVDNHWGELFKAAALSTFLAVGSEAGAGSDASNSNSAIIGALRRGASDSLNQAGQQVVRRSLNIQPTLTIRPGYPVRVLVNRDLILEPYRG